MAYDHNNIFAKILRKDIPSTLLYEDAFAVAFSDIAPAAPTHVLVIPRGAYTDIADFSAHASEAEIAGFFRAVNAVAQKVGAASFRLISNCGAESGQTVFHFHAHILSGKPMDALLPA